jgi:uncharacterized protein (TIGR02266 family)
MKPTSSGPTNRYDQRRSSRVRVHFSARYASSNLHLDGHVTDLSPDGLFFCSDYLDDQGEMARVWVDVPSRQSPLELRGEVRWVNDSPHAGGMGIRFIDVSLEDRELLSTLGAGLVNMDAVPTGNA